MDTKKTTKDLLKAAGVMAAAAMCPCIIAFGLGMAQAGPTVGEVDRTVETVFEQYNAGEAAGPMETGDGLLQTETHTALREGETEAETVSPRERAELMARVKHLSDYGKDEEVNPDYRKAGFVYTEEMYYKLTGATELPEDWTDQMGPFMRGIIREEDSFVETQQTDDGSAQEQWNPEGVIDASLYQTGTFTAETLGTGGPAAVQAAQRRIGYPYSQARRDSGIAFDCSSLVYWSYLDTGVDIDPVGGHTAASIAQYLEGTGKAVSGGDLMPGDLIFYSYKKNGRYKNISHVAMVAGDGMMVHASSSRKMVVMQSLSLSQVVAICRPLAGMEASAQEEQEMSEANGNLMLEVPEKQKEGNQQETQRIQETELEDAQEAAEGQETQEDTESQGGSPVITAPGDVVAVKDF